MSLWNWNGVDLEVNMGDVDFVEKYEKAFVKMEESENNLKKIGFNSAFLKGYCNMFLDLFDDIFGEGTSEKLFEGKMDVNVIEDCYDSFIDAAKKDVAETNKRRGKRIAKYAVKTGK